MPHARIRRRKSLILAHPPQQGLLEGFSAGLISLANYVSTHAQDVDVSLLDLGTLGPEACRAAVMQAVRTAADPLIVGIAATTASYFEALRTARLFKDAAPGVTTVLGGHHAAPQDDVILERHHGKVVDVVVRGEGERSLCALVHSFPDFESVPGISYWHEDRLRRNPAPPLLSTEELDQIGVTFRGGGIRSAPGKFDHVTYVSARGCPLGCHFCAVAAEAARAKSVPAVVADLRQLVHEHRYSSVAIEDNFFAQNSTRTIALCEAITNLQASVPTSFRWDCQTRVESLLNAEVVRAMKRARCEAVYLGVEALTSEQLGYLGKTRSPRRYLSLLREDVVPRLLQVGIDCFINLQLGVPGTTPQQVETLLSQLARLGALAERSRKVLTIFPQLHVVYPGTTHFREAASGCRFGPDTPHVFERFVEWEAGKEPVRTWLGEHFAHGTGGIPEGILVVDDLRRGEFCVDADAVMTVSSVLSEMADIPGVRVFRYGAYLARGAAGRLSAARAG